MQNLVLNAVQAMPGGGKVEIRADTVDCRQDEVPGLKSGRYARLDVTDEGVGIPPENLGRVFDPFFSTKTEGHGLGLTMCHLIVTRYGGAIAVSSRTGVGTRFSVYLPAAPVGEHPTADASSPIPRGRGKVLIMDDEPSVARVLSSMLKRLGYRSEVVSDGARAINAYASAKASGEAFDLVIMDMTIPGGMGGREAMERLRQLDPEVRAVVSSGYSSLTEYREYGFRGALTKPYTLKDLSAILQDVWG